MQIVTTHVHVICGPCGKFSRHFLRMELLVPGFYKWFENWLSLVTSHASVENWRAKVACQNLEPIIAQPNFVPPHAHKEAILMRNF